MLTDEQIREIWNVHSLHGLRFARAIEAEVRKQTTTSAEFALSALVAAGHVSQELVDRAMELPGAPPPVARAALTRQQLREAFHRDTGCTLGGDINLAERVCRVVERAHGITTPDRKEAP